MAIKLSDKQQAARDAAEAEAQRRQAIIDAGGDPDAPEHQLHPDGDQRHDQQAAVPHPGNWVALTDASTGTMTLLDTTAVTHISPGHGSRPNRNPKLQATAGNEMGPITEIGTIGGVVIRVLEEVPQVAALFGLNL